MIHGLALNRAHTACGLPLPQPLPWPGPPVLRVTTPTCPLCLIVEAQRHPITEHRSDPTRSHP